MDDFTPPVQPVDESPDPERAEHIARLPKFLLKRRKRRRKHRHKPGTPPGTLVSDPGAAAPRMSVVMYGPESFSEHDNISLIDLDRLPQQQSGFAVTWVVVEGLGDTEFLLALGNRYGLHHLSLEDVLSATHRSKAECYDDMLFVIVHSADPQTAEGSRQISHFLRKNTVVTFVDGPDPGILTVRERVRMGKGRMRGAGADYLLYALVDVAVDSYFPVIDRLGEQLDVLEERIIMMPQSVGVTEPHAAKRELLELRKTVWPLRDLVGDIERQGGHLMTRESLTFLRDCHDHAIQLIDLLETYRELASGLFDSYLTHMSTRLNEIMKLLTIIATIFIPLSFVASVYGMNFNTDISPWNMPELNWIFGYPFALLIMALVAGGLLTYFYRRGWIGAKSSTTPGPENHNHSNHP
jgi:magnesium transporter